MSYKGINSYEITFQKIPEINSRASPVRDVISNWNWILSSTVKKLILRSNKTMYLVFRVTDEQETFTDES